MDLKKLFQNNENWIKRKIDDDAEYFSEMAKKQYPHILYIGCSDSRVATEEILGLKPGEAFVHRNIANMVVSNDFNVMSVLNYSIEHLKVKHIIVCGHYGCGGIKAALGANDLGILNPWLANIKDVYRCHNDELNAISDETEKCKKLVEFNVEEQCINLLKTKVVQQAYKNKTIQIHGWVYDMHTGRVINLEIDIEEKFEKVMNVYGLNI